MGDNLKHISKFISLVLRHKPEQIGLELDENGWANVQDLILKINASGTFIDKQILTQVVTTNDKQRFIFNNDKTKIRTNQGHSIEIDLNLKPSIPPPVLYHGTAEKNLSSILKDGLQKMARHHVHLSKDITTATNVGARHGKPIVLKIDTIAMSKEGCFFYLSENNVWLTDNVNAKFIVQ